MPKVFISYSHRDEKALERLHAHLSMLRRDGLITEWYDREIAGGGNIDVEVRENLRQSEYFLALLSPDFLASDYCYEREMKEALKRHDDGSMRVIPVILEPCDWKASPLGGIKALPKDGQPISTWTNENIAYLDIVTELRRVLSAKKPSATRVQAPGRSTQNQEKAGRSPLAKRMKIKTTFDSIDRDDFRERSFKIIEDYFQRSIAELNAIGDPIRARFEKMSASAFSCTVLNKSIRNGEAHITVHAHAEGHFGEISYSFSHRAPPNTANGFIRGEASDYELHLSLDRFGMGDKKSMLMPEEAADLLWREFISHAGVNYD